MSANESFFTRRKAAAAFKHGILTVYPPVFLGKAGSVTDGRVVFLDGYAGQGRYDDGTPGSPLLFVQAALAKRNRAVRGIFVERDPQRHALLRGALDEVDPDGVVKRAVRCGDLGDLLPDLLPMTSGAALFAFLDPFGTALDVAQLRHQLLSRRGRAPTEVLLHFSISTIARMGGILNAGLARGGLTVAERKTVAHADAFLGGDWWHTEFEALRSVVPPTARDGMAWIDLDEPDMILDEDSPILFTATDVAMRIARRFCDDLGSATGYRTVSMPVRPEPGRAPKYVLVLFTRNDHGIWYFADALGRAGLHWQEALYEQRVRTDEARWQSQFGDEPSLFSPEELAPPPPPPFDRRLFEQENRERWEDCIAGNLYRLVAAEGSGLRLVDHIDKVYGDVLGQAFERHVRAAVKRLHASKLIEDDGKHEFWNRPIRVHIPHHRPPPPADSPSVTGRPAAGEAS